MDISQFEPFFPYIQGAVGGAVSAGVFKGPIQTLEEWWYVNFGHETAHKKAMLMAESQIKIELFKSEILGNAVKIDANNIQEPKLNIMGPALEASKYHIDEEDIRNMFAKLIASSMDSSKNDMIHPSFVEILKQMNFIDAQLLNTLSDTTKPHLIAQYHLKIDFEDNNFTNQSLLLMDNVFVENENIQSNNLVSPSITNLLRLGLIKIDFSKHYVYQNYEEIFCKTNDFIDLFNKIKSDEYIKKSINIEINPDIVRDKFNIELTKGRIELTDFGKNLSSICLTDS